MNRAALFAAAATFALMACSQQPVTPAASETGAAEAETSSTASAPAAEATTNAEVSPVPSPPAPSPEATGSPAAQTIPVALQGRWGLVPADCTSTRGDAKGLLAIDATTLKFYESRGTIGAIKERSDTRLRAGFYFTGEGMNWTRDEVLDVQDGGKTLIRREYGQDAAPGPFKYKKCV